MDYKKDPYIKNKISLHRYLVNYLRKNIFISTIIILTFLLSQIYTHFSPKYNSGKSIFLKVLLVGILYSVIQIFLIYKYNYSNIPIDKKYNIVMTRDKIIKSDPIMKEKKEINLNEIEKFKRINKNKLNINGIEIKLTEDQIKKICSIYSINNI